MDLLNPPQFELTKYRTSENPLHFHKKWEVCVFTQGKVLQTVNRESFVCTAGDIFILGPPHTHSLSIIEQPHGHQDIYFSDNDFKKICNCYSPNIYTLALNGALHFHLSPAEMNTILTSLQNISLLRLDEHEEMLNTCKMITHSILHYLIGLYLLQDLHKTKESFPPWFYKLLSMLQEPENFCLSVDEIVKTTGYSHSQFSVLFKKYASMSLIDFLMNKRLEYATELLLQTSKSTLEICMTIGYDSYSFFLKKFKEKYGLTPLQYRKKYGGDHNKA